MEKKGGELELIFLWILLFPTNFNFNFIFIFIQFSCNCIFESAFFFYWIISLKMIEIINSYLSMYVFYIINASFVFLMMKNDKWNKIFSLKSIHP